MVQNRKLIILIGLLSLMFVFIPIFISVFNNVSKSGKNKLEIQYAPSIMKLYIDGKKVSGQDHYLDDGEHVVSIEHPDFNKQETTVNIPNDKNAYLVSSPSTDKGRQIINNNINYSREMERVNDLYAQNNVNNMLSRYPFLKLLPIEQSGYYKIGYGDVSSDNKKGTQALYVRAVKPQDRQRALNVIAQKLTNPSEIEIIFSNSYNPFKQ